MSSFESAHVHSIYDSIASDFSRTRHTQWPFVHSFLSGLPVGSVVLDAGCGNGKYLSSHSVLPCEKVGTGTWGKEKGKAVEVLPHEDEERASILAVGYDMSFGLLRIAGGKGHEVVRGDCFDMSCWRAGVFDHAISIATIHHFATPERRLESVRQLILSVLPSLPSTSASPSRQSTILLVVWALEQDPSLGGIGSARRGKKGAVPVSGEAEVDPDEQDVFVPWELQAPKTKKVRPPPPTKKPRQALDPRPPPPPLDPAPPPPPPAAEAPPKPTFNRYYHLFRHHELSHLVASAALDLGASFVAPAPSSLPSLEILSFSSTRITDSPNTNLTPSIANSNSSSLEPPHAAAAKLKDGEGPEADGWELQVELLKGEIWERENWTVEIGVRWIRVGGGQ